MLLLLDDLSSLYLFLDLNLELPFLFCMWEASCLLETLLEVLDFEAERQTLQQQPGQWYHRVVLDEDLIHWGYPLPLGLCPEEGALRARAVFDTEEE